MFARVFALLPFAALAVASTYQCNTGAIKCCDTVGNSQTPAIASALQSASAGGLLGGVTVPVDAIIGLNCNTILGGGSCKQQPICCTDNTQVGLINIGCSPVSILS